MAEGQSSRLYGRSKGKTLRKEPRRLLHEALPKYAIAREGAIDPTALFARAPSDIWMEIGFGGGEHLIGMAGAHPEIGFIGCEPFVNGTAKILSLIEAGAHDNIRLYCGDAVELLGWLPDASLARVDLLLSLIHI